MTQHNKSSSLIRALSVRLDKVREECVTHIKTIFATLFIARAMGTGFVTRGSLVESHRIKFVVVYILLNKMHNLFYQKQSHGQHDFLASWLSGCFHVQY